MRSTIVTMLFLLPFLLCSQVQGQGFSLGERIPEVELEARTLKYYRPSLLLENPDSLGALEQLFHTRLRLCLELAGTLEILDHMPDSSTVGPGEWELLSHLRIVPPEEAMFGESAGPRVRADLSQGVENILLDSWELDLHPDRLAGQAEALASAVLELLTGYQPAFASHILFIEQDGQRSRMVLQDFFGESRQVLGTMRRERFSPAWSPNGQSYAYVILHPERGADIWLGNLAGGKARVLLEEPGTETAPAWSPDGNFLACALTRDGNTDIYLLPMDQERGRVTGKAIRLTHGPGIDTNPSWSPDGRHLVFSSDRSGSLQIYRMNSDGLDVQRLSFIGGASDCPAWSPDGEWILFVSRERQGYQLFQMRPDGTDWIRLSQESGNHFDPAWSPDGQLIVYNWRNAIWVARADGSNRRQLSSGSGESPAWRPVPELEPATNENE